MLKIKHLIYITFLFILACGGGIQQENTKFKTENKEKEDSTKTDNTQATKPEQNCDSLKSFQSIKISGHWIDIALPKPEQKIKGDLLILQGWSFPKDDWCKKSSLCKKALAEGYRLIMPEMGKSTYQSRNYPETRSDLLQYPTLKWLTDSLIPQLQKKYCLLQKGQNNFVLGLSTGARGAGLVAMNLPDLFKAAAALSGDFDQTKIPFDRIMTAFYGSFAKFPNRWQGEDNMLTNIEKFKTPFYLGHGKLDQVAPPNQTELFYNALKKTHPKLKVKLNMPAWAAHDYKYWDYEVDNMLIFFEEVILRK